MEAEPRLLGSGEPVVAVPPPLLELEDEGPDLIGVDFGDVGGQAFPAEEPLQAGDAAGHDIDGMGALVLGPVAEPIPLQKDSDFRPGF